MNTTEKDVYEDFVEDDDKFLTTFKDDAHIASFIENCGVEYDKNGSDGERYNPNKHSTTRLTAEQRGFHVYYAVPNGNRTPVGSFWSFSSDGRYKFVHVDLGKVMEAVIKYYENRGYMVPPKKEKSAITSN